MPLVIKPSVGGLNPARWAKRHRAFVEEQLQHYKAILFRGFELNTVRAFEAFAATLFSELLGDYGDLPRQQEAGKIYHSTPYAAEHAILLHNESSYSHSWPLRIMFCCLQAAETGGETPLLDSAGILSALDSDLVEEFTARQLLYQRNFGEGFEHTWQYYFQTEDKKEAERKCQAAGITFQWRGDNHFRILQRRPAVQKHPKIGTTVWFNQAALYHVSSLPPLTRTSLEAIFEEEALPRHVYFGDGGAIPDAAMNAIRLAYEREMILFSWQEGDAVLLDNMLAAHGRQPFTGPRKIAVAMGDLFMDPTV